MPRSWAVFDLHHVCIAWSHLLFTIVSFAARLVHHEIAWHLIMTDKLKPKCSVSTARSPAYFAVCSAVCSVACYQHTVHGYHDAVKCKRMPMGVCDAVLLLLIVAAWAMSGLALPCYGSAQSCTSGLVCTSILVCTGLIAGHQPNMLHHALCFMKFFFFFFPPGGCPSKHCRVLTLPGLCNS